MSDEVKDAVAEEETEVTAADTQKDRFMTFITAGECYAIAIRYVNEIITYQSITDVPETEDYVRGLINLRGKIIPVIDVRMRFGYDQLEYNDRTCIIITDVKGTVVGLIVEKIEEVVNISEEDILPPPDLGYLHDQVDRYIYGIGKVNDSVKLLIDPDRLIKDPEEEEEPDADSEDEEEEE